MYNSKHKIDPEKNIWNDTNTEKFKSTFCLNIPTNKLEKDLTKVL